MNIDEIIKALRIGANCKKIRNCKDCELFSIKCAEIVDQACAEAAELLKTKQPANLNELSRKIHATAVNHGWWENKPSFPVTVALCHSELSEAPEEYRNDKEMLYFKGDKPEGIAVEMADCIIRILDWCGYAGVDIDEIVKIKMAYNETRSYRHGGKRV